MGSTSYPDRRHFHAVSVRILINGTCNLLASNAIYYQLLELMQMGALFFQKSLQVGLVVADTARRVIAVHGLTSLVDQELLVVPADVAVAHRSVIQVGAVEEDVTCRWTASLEESVERMLGSSVHFDLAEEGDSVRNEIVSGADVTNAVVNLLSRGSRLLQVELVARESQ